MVSTKMVDVLLTDQGIDYKDTEQHFANIDAWAQKYCPSYVGYHVQDVSDFSYYYDEIACYQFNDEKCANWFRLKWSRNEYGR